jgi:plastocyanin
VNNHEAAGADCLSCHSACQAQAEVTIEPATATLNPGDTQTFTANTTGGDNDPVYTWEVQGGTVSTGNTGNTTNTIEYTAGNTPGDYTITVTDTANGNIQATATVTIEAEVSCSIAVLRDQIPKSHWVALPTLIRILTTDFEISQATEVTFTSDNEGNVESVIPLVKLVNPNMGIINQLVLIPPAIATGNFDAETEEITVAVEGCAQTDTFDLKLLSLGPIPLSK